MLVLAPPGLLLQIGEEGGIMPWVGTEGVGFVCDRWPYKVFTVFVTILLLFYLLIFLAPHGMWILVPQPGIEPTPPALEGEVLTTGPSGNPPYCFLFLFSEGMGLRGARGVSLCFPSSHSCLLRPRVWWPLWGAGLGLGHSPVILHV